MPLKSIVWAHFDRGTKACRYCGKIVLNAGNTTNLWNHLKKKHQEVLPANSNDRPTDEELVDDPGEQVHEVASSLSTASTPIKPTTAQKQGAAQLLARPTIGKQPTITSAFSLSRSFAEGGGRAVEIDDAALFMIVKDKMPLSATENKGFRYFAKKAVPLWKPPSRGKITTRMEQKYQILHYVVKEAISCLPSVCLTADCWTERHTNTSYLGVTVHFLYELQIESAVVGLTLLLESHTGVYLSQKIEEFCENWGISNNRVSVIVTDNAENIKLAAKSLFGANRHVPCFDHTLNLIPKSALGTQKNISGEQEERVPGLPGLIKKIRDIVTFSHTSNNFANELKRIQLDIYNKSEGTVQRLVQDVETRWNSTFLMTKRFTEMSDIVATAALRFPSVKMLTARELSTITAVNEVLLPFHQATIDMSSESSATGSKAIPMARMLIERISIVDVPEEDGIACKLKMYVQSELHRRFDGLEKVMPLAVATILDPRFKNLHFRSPEALANTLSFISKEFKNLVKKENDARRASATVRSCSPQENSTPRLVGEDIWSIHDAQVAHVIQSPADEDFAGGLPVEFRQYLNRPVVPRNTNPFEAWENMRYEYPRLHTLSQLLLPLLATSTPSERLFSQVGLIITDLRSRLTPEHLSQLTFLSSVSEKVWHLRSF